MLIPRTHAWTRKQRWLVVTSVVVALSVLAAAVYAYERHHRGPTDAVFVGLWQMEGMCMDCTFYFLLQPDHTVLGIGEDRDLRSPGGRGRWYAGGELLVVHYSTAEATNSIVMRIVDITPDVIHVRKDGREFRMIRTPIPPQAPRLNFVVQHLLGLKEALIGCFVAMSFSWSVIEVFGD
jgi:hypothetical protein